MLKYVETLVTFSEFPDEISLCINISNCPNACVNCHSSYLKEDIGTILDYKELDKLIQKNHGITCIGFMGGDRDPSEINKLAKYIKDNYNLKIGWYSGSETLSNKIDVRLFNFIKIGPYIEKYGPLNKRTTNQRMYENINGNLDDITYKFWKK